MKILIISQYFWPENFRINEVVKFLKLSGNDVEVLTGKPNYPEGEIFEEYLSEPNKFKEYYGAKVYRLNSRPRKKGSKFDLFLNYSSFLSKSIFFSLSKLRKKKYDIIFTFGTSPVTTSITSIILSKFTGSKTALWVLDLWPDIVFELNIIKNKILKKNFSNLMEGIYKKTDLILAQSPKFKKKISQKINSENKVKVLYQWPETLDTISEDKNLNKNFEQKDLNIVFTGNIGTAQNFEHVIKVANSCEHLNVKWHIIGTGRDLNNIISLGKISKKILFYGLRDNSEMMSFLNKADVLLISLREGEAINSTIPGKLQTYLLANKPILGSISGEAARIITESKIGLVSNPGDENQFILNIKKFYELKIQKKLETNTSELINLFDKNIYI
jgi:glycosyltransferase involved in cell wall biosynthesis